MKFGISLDLEEFEKKKAEAIKIAKEEDGDDYSNTANFYNLDFESEGFEFDAGEVTIYGDTPLGWIDVKFKMDLDDVISVIEHYMKKLGKLKTVLEATK